MNKYSIHFFKFCANLMEIIKRLTPKQLNQTRNHFSRNFLCYCVSLANASVYFAHTCSSAMTKLVRKRLNITNTATIIISGKENRCNSVFTNILWCCDRFNLDWRRGAPQKTDSSTIWIVVGQ